MQWDEHKFMAVHTLNTKKNSMTFKGRWVHRAPYFIISASMLLLPFTILTGLFFWISLQDRPDLWRFFNNLWGLLVQDSYRQNALVTQPTESKHGRNKDGGIFIIYSHRELYLLSTVTGSHIYYLQSQGGIFIMPCRHRVEALSDDAHVMSVCLTSVCLSSTSGLSHGKDRTQLSRSKG